MRRNKSGEIETEIEDYSGKAASILQPCRVAADPLKAEGSTCMHASGPHKRRRLIFSVPASTSIYHFICKIYS